jgi:hypothetical protein
MAADRCGSPFGAFARFRWKQPVLYKVKERKTVTYHLSFDTRIKKIHCSWKTNRLSFNGQPIARSGGDFDSRYSQRGVQWAVKTVAKSVGITKDVHAQSTSYSCHAFARRRHGYYHAQRPFGPQNLWNCWIFASSRVNKIQPMDTFAQAAHENAQKTPTTFLSR